MALDDHHIVRSVILVTWSVVMGGAGLYFGLIRHRIPLKTGAVTGRDAVLGGASLVAMAVLVLYLALR